MNFQVSIMRILSAYPNGLAKHEQLKQDLAILATSGKDWSARSKKLAAALPPTLDVFRLGFVSRYAFGWRLTKKGKIALEMMEQFARNSPMIGPNIIAAQTWLEKPTKDFVAIQPAKSLYPLASRLGEPASRRANFVVIDGGKTKAA
jgi:hypothetical protein